MKRQILVGSTDQTIDVFIMDSSSSVGAGLTGLVYNTASLVCYYRKGATGTPTALTLATQTVGGAHSDGGFVAVDGTNCPGQYRLDLSDTIVAAAGAVTLYLRGATNMAPCLVELEVVNFCLTGQSATDLKDFADDGYDPSTNKVQGVVLTDTVTTYTGNTVQTGDSYAIVNSGTHGNAAIKGFVDDIGVAGAGLTAVPWNAAWDAEVQSEAEDALVAHRLDELLNADSDIDGAAPPTVGSVFHELMSKTAGSFTFDQSTDSCEALRDRGDAAWVTATGFSTLSAADVRSAVGLASANLDTQLAAIVADTNELQTDWANGGRLDLLLDTTISQTAAAALRTALGLASANIDTQLAAITADLIPSIAGTVAASPSPTISSFGTNLVFANTTDLTERTIVFDEGTATAALRGQSRVITSTTVSGGILSFDEDWSTAPASGDTFRIFSLHNHSDRQIGTSCWANATRTLTAIDEDSTTLDLDATIRSAIGIASANLDTQLDALPTAAENAAALMDLSNGIETSITLRQALRLILAAAAGKLSGAATTTVVIRNVGDAKDRITATVDADGNRSAVTVDAT